MKGQGPEHSSARARALPAALRARTISRSRTAPRRPIISTCCAGRCTASFRKPLVILTPKSLLRHKLAVSKARRISRATAISCASCRIRSAPADAEVKRLVLCTGKVAYDLIEARDAAGDKNTAIVRVEQLYPFPSEPLTIRLATHANLEEVVWAQEEPKNNGGWSFVEPLHRGSLSEAAIKPQRAALCRPHRRRFARDRPDETPPAGTGGARRRRARPYVREEIRRTRRS